MISIKKNKSNDHVYKFSYFKDGVTLISESGYYLKKEKLYWNDYPIAVTLEALHSEILNDLPCDIGFYIEEPIAGSLFSIYGFKCHRKKLVLEFASYSIDPYWETSLYNPKQILKRMKEILTQNFSFFEINDGSYSIHIKYEKDTSEHTTIGDFVQEGINALKKVEKLVGIDLGGFKWRAEYENDEVLFSREVVSLMIRKMGFKKIQYINGPSEYGKDFVFSDLDKFGNFLHFGMQVKAGDIRGTVNGRIDKLIGQLDDAFKMPFSRDNEPACFISSFYIVTSGRFTENAKQKLLNKMPKEYSGKVHIIDKERIMELLTIYY